MASNKNAWLRNDFGDTKPLIKLGYFAAGSTRTVCRGEIIYISTITWIPLASDTTMANIIAVANEEIKSTDLAGYYQIIVPRPGDVFEFELATATACATGAALYYSTSQKLTTSGSNIVAYVNGQAHYPQQQGHMSDGDPVDRGSTVNSASYVQCSIATGASWYGAIYK